MPFVFVLQLSYTVTLNMSLDLSESLTPRDCPPSALLCSCDSRLQEVSLQTTAAALNFQTGSGQQQPALRAL